MIRSERPRRASGLFPRIAPACIGVFLALSSPAVAGDYDPNGSGSFTANPGETNHVTFSSNGVTETITDTGAVVTVQPGFGCTGGGTNTVQCPVDSTFGPGLGLGDMNDSGTIGTTPPPPLFTGEPVASFDGGAGVDTLTGNSERDQLIGGTGADIINGGGGDDFLLGGPDGDTVHGDGGDDSVNGGDFGNPAGAGDQLFGDAGDDGLSDQDSDPGPADADVLDGGSGQDFVGSYSGRSANVTINLATGAGNGVTGENDTLTAVEEVTGGNGNDIITGSAAAEDLDGDNGTDTILGGAGDDSIAGGSGNDPLLDGQADRDRVGGDGGNDTVRGGSEEDTVRGDDGTDSVHGDGADDIVGGGGGLGDQVFGEAGDDDLSDDDDENTVDADSLDGGSGIDQVVSYALRQDEGATTLPVTIDLGAGLPNNGAAGENDTLASIENAFGGSAGDTLTGSSGENELRGGGGADTISAAGGSDAVLGGGGADVLTGGTERDEMRGGSGADILNSADGGSDQVGCGSEVDTVNGEPQDIVEADCEVLNGGAVVGSALGGAPGDQGPAGAQGPRGPAGTATCVVTKPKKGKKLRLQVRCAVASAKRAKAKLKRHGRTVARGTGDGTTVRLRGGKMLRRGHYVLAMGNGDDRTRTRVRIR